MIVITLSKTPNSLRGDLTKWCQEIQTGVYVGNVNAKVRDLLWERVEKNIGSGEATLVYNTNNELGYTFKTTRKDRKVVDFDGIPFLMRVDTMPDTVLGFSTAARFHKAHKVNASSKKNWTDIGSKLRRFVAIDLETTGLNAEKNNILSMAAVKYDEKIEVFYKLIKEVDHVPANISKITGLTPNILHANGASLKSALEDLKVFMEDRVIVGYNLPFDMSFLENECKNLNIPFPSNIAKDLLPIVKRKNKFLDNYHLNTVLKNYDIKNEQPHHADSDAKSTWYLAKKLLEENSLIIK